MVERLKECSDADWHLSQLVECIEFDDSAEIEMDVDDYVLEFMNQKVEFDVVKGAANSLQGQSLRWR